MSIRALVYCLLTGRDQLTDEAIPTTPKASEGADRIVPDIVDAASRGLITFYGRPTQTRFPINDAVFDDDPKRAIRKAVTILRRSHISSASDEAELAERTLSDSPEVVPSYVWHIDALAWEADHLLVWDSASLDSRFEVCRPRPEWVENRAMLQPLGKNVSTEGNPYLRDLPQYDPMQITGYSHLVCNAADIGVLRKEELAKLQKPKGAKSGAGRKDKWDYDAINSAAETLLRENRVPIGTWKMVVHAVIGQAVIEGAEKAHVSLPPDTWTRHLRRSGNATLKDRLEEASR